MTPTDAQQVAADIAALLAEKPHGKWSPVLPGDARGLIAGHEVMPHVQSFADKVMVATGVKSIGTYPDHSPSIDRALDLFHRIGDHALADAICEFGIANQKRFGVRYIISRQRIWHRLDPVWRWMEDRGSPTQNHMDHPHIAFETTVAEVPDEKPDDKPKPVPTPKTEESDAVRLYRYDNQWWTTDSQTTRPTNITFPWHDTGAKTLFDGKDIKGTDLEGFHAELAAFTDQLIGSAG